MTDVAVVALLVLQGAGSSRVAVESATTCPGATEVEARLAALLPPVADGVPRERAEISAEGDTLRVHLTAADGTFIGERTLTLDASCADRANVVAVVIAAWEAQQRPEQVPAPTLPSRPPPQPLPEAPRVAIVAPPSAAAVPPPIAVEIGIGPAVTLAGGAFFPSGRVTLGAWGRRVGARLVVFGMWPQQEDLAGGRARWTRAGAALEGGRRFSKGRGRLDIHAGPVLGAVFASGAGFERDQTTGGLSPGLTGGIDGSWTLGHFALGLGAAASGWTTQRLVASSTDTAVHPLPRFDISFGATVGVVFP